MQKTHLTLLGRPFPLYVVPGLRLGRLLLTCPTERLPGESGMAFVERIVREKPALTVNFEEGERGFEEQPTPDQ